MIWHYICLILKIVFMSLFIYYVFIGQYWIFFNCTCSFLDYLMKLTFKILIIKFVLVIHRQFRNEYSFVILHIIMLQCVNSLSFLTLVFSVLFLIYVKETVLVMLAII